jgi:hypothetical protein
MHAASGTGLYVTTGELLTGANNANMQQVTECCQSVATARFFRDYASSSPDVAGVLFMGIGTAIGDDP